MRLVERLRDRELRVVVLQSVRKPRDEVIGQERRVAGNGDRVRRLRMNQSGVQSGKRSCKAADGVRHDRMPERGVTLAILVGIDENRADLRCEVAR